KIAWYPSSVWSPTMKKPLGSSPGVLVWAMPVKPCIQCGKLARKSSILSYKVSPCCWVGCPGLMEKHRHLWLDGAPLSPLVRPGIGCTHCILRLRRRPRTARGSPRSPFSLCRRSKSGVVRRCPHHEHVRTGQSGRVQYRRHRSANVQPWKCSSSSGEHLPCTLDKAWHLSKGNR